MKKQLSEMNYIELEELSPVIISDPDPNWPGIFENEKEKILASLGKHNILSIEHIGSMLPLPEGEFKIKTFQKKLSYPQNNIKQQ